MSPETTKPGLEQKEQLTSNEGLEHAKATKVLGTTLGISYEAAAIGGIVVGEYTGAALFAIIGAGVLISIHDDQVRSFVNQRLNRRKP